MDNGWSYDHAAMDNSHGKDREKITWLYAKGPKIDKKEG